MFLIAWLRKKHWIHTWDNPDSATRKCQVCDHVEVLSHL